MKKNLKIYIGGKEKLFFKKTHFTMSFPLAVWRKKMELCKKIHNIAWRIEP